MNIDNYSYVVLTAAFNEEQHIQKTIESVTNQSILPKRWVIVSDGSTDRTDDIIKDYSVKFNFIKFVRRDKSDGRSFSSKVLAMQEGFKYLIDMDYSFYCTLDADVSFNKTYFQSIMEKFIKNHQLGIAGGIIFDFYDNKPHKVIANLSSVAGAIQFFRRQCYECTGGYSASEIGGEDAILEIIAKKNGWEVRSFPEFAVYHYRRRGTADNSILKGKYLYGVLDYRLGNPFIFELLKCLYRLKERPFIISGMMICFGYLLACIKKPAKLLSMDEIAFIREEQMSKLLNYFKFPGKSYE